MSTLTFVPKVQGITRLLNGFMQPPLRSGCAYKRGRLHVNFRPFPVRLGCIKGERKSVLCECLVKVGLVLSPVIHRRASQTKRDHSEHCLSATSAEHSASCGAPASTRSTGNPKGGESGCPFFWLLFFRQVKKSDTPSARA
jgi:hypothetical protein